MNNLNLPVGWYKLPDGREFYGMNEFELQSFVREGWRLQRIADVRLALRLETASSCPVGPVVRRIAKDEDQFSLFDSVSCVAA